MAPSSKGSEVILHMYDISGGIAPYVSPLLLFGMERGIWHTGIVVFGYEYYWCGDICTDFPGRTPFGLPSEVLRLGTTLRTERETDKWLNTLWEEFNEQSYDLFRKNCNHFCDKLSMFLVAQHIPEEVLKQGERAAGSPFASMIQGYLAPPLSETPEGVPLSLSAAPPLKKDLKLDPFLRNARQDPFLEGRYVLEKGSTSIVKESALTASNEKRLLASDAGSVKLAAANKVAEEPGYLSVTLTTSSADMPGKSAPSAPLTNDTDERESRSTPIQRQRTFQSQAVSERTPEASLVVGGHAREERGESLLLSAIAPVPPVLDRASQRKVESVNHHYLRESLAADDASVTSRGSASVASTRASGSRPLAAVSGEWQASSSSSNSGCSSSSRRLVVSCNEPSLAPRALKGTGLEALPEGQLVSHTSSQIPAGLAAPSLNTACSFVRSPTLAPRQTLLIGSALHQR